MSAGSGEGALRDERFQEVLEENVLVAFSGRRFAWLRIHLVVSKALDEGLWRFQRLRHLMGMGDPTDPEELTAIECCYEVVRTAAPKLFEGSDFTLGSPIPLMRDILSQATALTAPQELKN